ncbi:hypothetical protein [Serratia fonticola]|uniref:hypothetical protein n=1 Tax=Serratia fonticola TaxID=47917 RepID=UPI00192D1298|nr:hypothetical protein [Serratia fonticola]MBL5825408.1 hypothetical protein [Serratia fonticola]
MKEVLVFGLGYNGKVFQVQDYLKYLSLSERPKDSLVLSYANSPRNPQAETIYQLTIDEWVSENGQRYLIAVSGPQPSRKDIEAAIRLKDGWDAGRTMKVMIDGEVVERPAGYSEPIVESGLIEVTTLNHTMPEFITHREGMAGDIL